MRRFFLIATMALGVATAASVARASTTFGFELVFDVGPLSGSAFPGAMVLDLAGGTADPADPDTILFTPSNGLLSFDVTVGGVSFSSADDDGFPTFPEIVVAVSSSSLLVVDYLSIADPALSGLSIFFDADLGSNFVGFDPAVGSTESGSTGFFRQTGVIDVPDTGSTLALLGVALAGAGAFRRRLGISA